MSRPAKTATGKATLTGAAEDSDTFIDETSAIEDGKILDYITDKPVAENDKERVRQRIARAVPRVRHQRRRHGARLQGKPSASRCESAKLVMSRAK